MADGDEDDDEDDEDDDESKFWKLMGNSGTNPPTNFLGTSDNQDLVIKTNGTEAARIDTDGNTGIGTDDPQAPLHVIEQSPGNTLILDAVSEANPNISFRTDGQFQANIRVADSLDGQLQFHVGESFIEALSIDQSGNVGIGRTDPTRKLDVNGFFRQTNGHMLFRDGLENAVFVVQDGTHPDDKRPNRFVFRSVPDLDAYDASQSTIDMMVIENTGHVGIGTSEPESTLDVAGRITADEGFFGGYRAGEYAALFQDGARNTIVWNQRDGGGAIWLIPESQNGLIIAQDLATLNAGTGAHWIGVDGSDGSIYFNERGLDADVRIFRPDDRTFAISTDDVERLRIDGDGNVGKGTDSPLALLHVFESSPGTTLLQTTLLLDAAPDANPNILFTTEGELQANIRVADFLDGQLQLQVFDGSTLISAVSIDPSGNVGIGTIDPQSALHVSGYTQLDLTTGAPPAADCDEASEHGRMKVDPSAGVFLLYICTADGWVAK